MRAIKTDPASFRSTGKAEIEIIAAPSFQVMEILRSQQIPTSAATSPSHRPNTPTPATMGLTEALAENASPPRERPMPAMTQKNEMDDPIAWTEIDFGQQRASLRTCPNRR